MEDPKKKRYLYLMLSGFGSISLSVVLFFLLYRLQGIGVWLKNISGILAPFIYGGVVAYLLRPLCNTYERFLEKHLPDKMKKMASSMAVFGSLLTGLLMVYALAAMIVPQVVESLITLGKTIPGRIETFISWAEETFGENEYMDGVFTFFNTSYDKLSTTVNAWIRETIPQITTLVSSVGSSVYNMARSVYNLVIGLIVAVYVLFSRKRFARQGVLIVRSTLNERAANILLEEIGVVDRMFGGFIDAKILDSLIIGILCYIGCLILGIPNTLLISVFVGVTNIIPFFGPLIGAVPSTLLILIESPIQAVWFVVFVIVLQQLDGNVIGPKILGNTVGISGFWVLASITIAASIFGFAGMLLGVPVFALIYVLISDGVNAAKEAAFDRDGGLPRHPDRGGSGDAAARAARGAAAGRRVGQTGRGGHGGGRCVGETLTFGRSSWIWGALCNFGDEIWNRFWKIWVRGWRRCRKWAAEAACCGMWCRCWRS